MPKVRVFLQSGKYPLQLVNELVSRGLDVEVCILAKKGEPAGVEFTVELCNPENLEKVINGTGAKKDLYILAGTSSQKRSVQSVGIVLLMAGSSEESTRNVVIPSAILDVCNGFSTGRIAGVEGYRGEPFAHIWDALKPENLNAFAIRQKKEIHFIESVGKRTLEELAALLKGFCRCLIANLVPRRADTTQLNHRLLAFWKMIPPLGAAAAVAIVLLAGYSRTRTNVRDKSQPKAEASIEATRPSQARTSVLHLSKGTPDTTSAAPETHSDEVSMASDGQDYYDVVVVRHFKTSASFRSSDEVPPKRRVVLD